MKRTSIPVTLIVFIMIIGSAWAQSIPITEANYELPARFSPNKLKQMVFSTNADAHWLKHSDRFWYEWETSEGKTFYIVDPGKKTKKPIFDNVKMAAELTRMTKDPYDAQHLPIERFKFVKEDRFIRFEVTSSQEEIEEEEEKEKEKEEEKKEEKEEEKEKKEEEKKEDEKEKEKDQKDKQDKKKPAKKKKPKKKVFYFEYELATGKLHMLEDYEKPKERPRWASISPDSQYVVFSKHFNLYWMDKENYLKALEDEEDSTIVEHQLTTDGEEYYAYGGRGRGETNVDKEKNKDKRKSAYILWSRDSKKFAMTRSDSRKVKDLWVINSVAEPRPTLETYKYHMPGESEAPIVELLVFDMETKEKCKVEADRFKDQMISIESAPRLARNRDDDHRPGMWLSETPDKVYFTRTSRDLKRIDVCVADAATGEVKVLIEERLNTYVETRRLGLVNNGEELIHWSERDGWAHFYLYDGDGNQKNQITSGPFHCNNITGIDERNRVLFFTANARESDEDPYYIHLYRVNFDGTGLRLLDPGNFNHSVSLSDSKRYFVDNYSRVNTIPKSEVRDSGGNKVMDLEEADLSLLFTATYQFPEPFKVKAADGITDIYGVMYKPFDFDETRTYPVIAYVYPGPQTEAVNKSFSTRMDRTDRLAQFGFVVVTMGNRGGHPSRSKWYHNYGYGNLRDYGLADKKSTIEQLAARHSFIDVDKVGIFGHSGGGFMSTAALLVYPDFFKVAVSSSGNHENNIYNRWWSEKHHGVKEVEDDEGKITFEYDIEKNSEVANNLKGRLLICTGDIDNNVHPANTIRLANALIKANKRFDFFLFPGQTHGFGNMNEYFFWLRADYFCKHLIGDYADGVDIVQITRDIELGGNKK